MVASGRGNDPTGTYGRIQVGHFVVCPAQLKGKHCLYVFTFQEQAVIQAARQQGGQFERALNGHIVYLCRENFCQIVVVYRISASLHNPLTSPLSAEERRQGHCAGTLPSVTTSSTYGASSANASVTADWISSGRVTRLPATPIPWAISTKSNVGCVKSRWV